MMSKIKNFLFEKKPAERKPSRPRTADVRTELKRSVQNPQAEKIDYRAYILIILLFVAAVGILLSGNSRTKYSLDPVTLCPNEEEANFIPSRTYVLMDLSEPLGGQQQALRGLINAASNSLEAREKIIIGRLQPNRGNSWKELSSFCSPDLKSISDSFGRSISLEKDCPEIISKGKQYPWPLGTGQDLREQTRKICESYSRFQKKVRTASEVVPDDNPEEPRSYIVSAIEEIMHDANNAPNGTRRRLIVFSDMLQHAEWFSHYEESHAPWTAEALKDRRKKASGLGSVPENKFDEILLCYLKTDNLKDYMKNAKWEVAHKKMWPRYFGAPKKKVLNRTAAGCGSAASFMMGKAEA